MTKKFLHFLFITFSFSFLIFSEVSAASLEEAKAAYEAQDYQKAFPLFKELAEGGNAEAQFFLSYIYQNGEGTEADPKKEAKWMKLAADNGHGQAQNHMGFYYYYGHLVEEDPDEAIRYLLMASENQADLALFNFKNIFEDLFFKQKLDVGLTINRLEESSQRGFKVAEYFLSFFYQHGLGVNESPAKAMKSTERAAKEGYLLAETRLAEMYLQGYGTGKNEKLAYKWYRAAAEQGDAYSNWVVGMFYVQGTGVEMNYYEAVKWFEIAASKNLPEGITSLAVMYANGQGVEQDYLKAHDLYMQIATKGFAHAQRALGQMYYHGQGVSPNAILAKVWLDLAAEQGHEIAIQEAKNMIPELTEGQLLLVEEKKAELRDLIEKNRQ